MKILLVANTDWYLHNFRLPLAQELREQGHSVILVSPPGKYVQELLSLGFEWSELYFERSGLNPFQEMLSLAQMCRLYWRERPDLVHHFTIKPVIYGSMAARLADIKVTVNSITGLGYVFTGQRKWLEALASYLYRSLLGRTWVIFQNPDDQSTFVSKGFVNPARCSLIRSSGVDTRQFQASPEPDGTPVVMLAARLLWDKGVGDFVEAARILKQGKLQARFVLVGDVDEGNPSTIPLAVLDDWQKQNLVEWWGWKENMAEIYGQAHLVCLPSYHEGLPKTLIEAAACERAIVASDIPGCREIVHHNINGLLVPVHAPDALADALKLLISQPSIRREFARAGRQMAVDEFDVRRVVGDTITLYRKAFTSLLGSIV